MKRLIAILSLASMVALSDPVPLLECYVIEVAQELMDTPKERAKICKALGVEDAGWKPMTNAVNTVWIYDTNEWQLKGKQTKEGIKAKLNGIPGPWRKMITVYVNCNLQDFAAMTGRHERPE